MECRLKQGEWGLKPERRREPGPRDLRSPNEGHDCYSGDRRSSGRNLSSFYLLLLCFPKSHRESGFLWLANKIFNWKWVT